MTAIHPSRATALAAIILLLQVLPLCPHCVLKSYGGHVASCHDCQECLGCSICSASDSSEYPVGFHAPTGEEQCPACHADEKVFSQGTGESSSGPASLEDCLITTFFPQRETGDRTDRTRPPLDDDVFSERQKPLRI